MNIQIKDSTYYYNYQHLKTEYQKFVDLSDDDFLDVIEDVQVLAAKITYLKELPREEIVSQEGIMYKLANVTYDTIIKAREAFESTCRLA